MNQMNDKNELFWQLLKPEYKRAMMYCRKLMQHREKGDDLFQDAIVTAIRKIDQLREQNAFRPWFYRIVINTFNSEIKKHKKRTFMPFDTETEQILPAHNPANIHFANIWLEKLFKALKPDEQSLIILFEMEQWTLAEIGEMYGKSEGAIKPKLFRTRAKLKKELSRLTKNRSAEVTELKKLMNAYAM
ncbi:MAG: RNA polymerase sigma factor [Calditrichaeota bacterium]|nr:MAG: RNA polymerase sigma factor [Calditrichota bacterium]